MCRHAFDAACKLMNLDELFPLLVCLGNYPFTHVVMGNGIFVAKGVHHLTPFNA